jgi:hypothetical protein
MSMLPSQIVIDAVGSADAGGLLDGATDFTINGQPVIAPATSKPPSVELPGVFDTVMQSPLDYTWAFFSNYWKSTKTTIIDPVIGANSEMVYEAVVNDPSGFWTSLTANSVEAGKEIAANAETVGNVITSGTGYIGSITGNLLKPLIIPLLLVAIIMVMWFAGPWIKAAGKAAS